MRGAIGLLVSYTSVVIHPGDARLCGNQPSVDRVRCLLGKRHH